MKLRSLLFVPADRPERFAKAAASGADAIILDLEDSVAPERKAYGREAIEEWLASPRDCVAFVRVNPLDGDHTRADLAAVLPASPDGIMLPKAEGVASIQALIALADGANVPPILPIATETPAAIFELGTFRQVRERLAGLTWGAEDLPASVGASTSREEDGRYTAPFELARSLTLFAAHAAGVPAIDTVFPQIEATDDLNAYIGRARRDGFTGMMAIHPVQVAAINDGFTPSETEIARARAVIEAFAANPGAGVLKLDGKMIDRPHLVQAQRVLAAAE
ncbi:MULTISPECIES: HpcH/HpaI aldolase/citrate lyase family protein [Sphingobium]|uniref:Hydroxymethylglutaryl-CoA lyase n=1 Tax=Sphingobium fuliginis (strain ATCC 27551) TaxID=336203 RepID=A0A292ZJJ0_SPHSA|nr:MULTISPECIES: CoA ester lyase [Sphingobium]PNP96975.1 citrate lyase [Sphingobium sp. SA916]GAY23030.1 hydroxymethylglutaryl-CoA lyase [Sphingobium fuliginis]